MHAFGDYGLLPPSQETPYDRYKLRIFPTSSSSNFRNRDSGKNTISSWSSTWLLHISDGKTFNLATGTIKRVTEKPLSGCHRLFSRMHKHTQPVMSPSTTRRQRTIKDVPEAHTAEIHPVQMTKILRDVFQEPQLAHKYAKHLDKKVQVVTSSGFLLASNRLTLLQAGVLP